MRKLKLQMRITVDGFLAGPNGEEDWDVKTDEKLWQLINELPDSFDTLLIGRKMAEVKTLRWQKGILQRKYQH